MNARFCLFVALAASAAVSALATPVMAEPRDDVRAGSARCDGIADDRTWLDCYYGAAQPMRARLGLAPAPNAQQALVPPGRPGAPAPTGPAPAPFQLSNTDPSGRPGIFGRLFTHTAVKAEPPTHMKSYSFDKAGFFTVTLLNGEVWKQSTVDSVQARWHNRPDSYVVTIQPDSRMNVGSHETYMVERIR